MKISPVILIGAFGATVLWAAKAVAIGVAGGLDKSPAESPLFLLGLLSFVTAVAALGWTALAGRHIALRLVGAVGAVVGGALVTSVLNALVSAVVDSDHWVWAEVNLWVLALGLLAFVVNRAVSSER